VSNKVFHPVVTNGKVYAIATTAVNVYGLLNGEATTAAPVIAPNAAPSQQPDLSHSTSATGGAQIYYTLERLNAHNEFIALFWRHHHQHRHHAECHRQCGRRYQSSISTAVFNFSMRQPTPTFFPAAGPTPVAKSDNRDTDANAQIYYTLTGTPRLFHAVHGPQHSR